MKTLENKEILSDDVLNAILKIQEIYTNIVFGGSVVLNALHLINRKIGDLDIFFPLHSSLSNIVSIASREVITSDTAIIGEESNIQRTGLEISNIKVCCFKVPEKYLQCSEYSFIRDGKNITINIQNINYAIEAKRNYISIPKHKDDLEEIDRNLSNLSNGTFLEYF